MGAKNFKAIAVKGTKMPEVADHKKYLDMLENARDAFKGAAGSLLADFWRSAGTAAMLSMNSCFGNMTVKNFQEGTFKEIDKIDADAAKEKI